MEEIEVENKIRKELLELERNEFEKNLKYLADIRNKKGSSAAIFKLKEQILGSKKSGQDAVCMEDPDTGQIIVEKESLKNASVRYVSKLLTNRDPKEEYKAEFQIMENLHEIRLDEKFNEDIELTKDDFQKLLKQLSRKHKEKYQFILKAGNSYHYVLFILFKKIWETERKPASWKEKMCHQLYKGKGSKNEFSNQRFIHSKEDFPKAFEQLVISKAKPNVIENCTQFQLEPFPGTKWLNIFLSLRASLATITPRIPV